MIDYLKRAQAVSKHSGRVAKKVRRARRGAEASQTAFKKGQYRKAIHRGGKAVKNASQARKQIVKTNNARMGIFVE
tara:strand:- start:372 stop:599 length:228 start_codon:yes stop_codon:yes gene_type:complete